MVLQVCRSGGSWMKNTEIQSFHFCPLFTAALFLLQVSVKTLIVNQKARQKRSAPPYEIKNVIHIVLHSFQKNPPPNAKGRTSQAKH